MLAPYIPMDDDFQLRSLDQLSPLTESPATPPSTQSMNNVIDIFPQAGSSVKDTPHKNTQTLNQVEKIEPVNAIKSCIHVNEMDNCPEALYCESSSRTASPVRTGGKGPLTQQIDTSHPQSLVSPVKVLLNYSKR